MTGVKAASSSAAVAGAAILTVFLCAGPVRAQAGTESPTFETIKVTGGRPVSRAMDVIEKRYGVLIDYMDVPYVVVPKTRTLSVRYWQVPGTPKSVAPIYRCNVATLGCAPVTTKPEEGIRALIQQVLDEFAEQGGQVFAVRKLEMPYGARWEVYPTEARDRLGAEVAQTDLLSARIFIPEARRWPAQMFELVAQQLTRESGTKFSVGLIRGVTIDPAVPAPGERPPKLGANGVSAWRAIADLMGPKGTLGVLRARYGICEPNCGYDYGINVVGLPYREPPRPPTPAPIPARALPPGPRPPGYWLGRARTPEGIKEVQQGLAKLGYLRTAPTTRWDANAGAALQRFQRARGLPETGKFDHWTALMLSPSLPLVRMVVPAKPAMSDALLYWLNTTPDGWRDVQRALVNAGFYNGPIDGELYPPTKKALQAFQTANGLKPTGALDWATAVKLSPFLPQPK